MSEEIHYCFYCGEPSDLLCDGILGFLKKTKFEGGKVREAIDTSDLSKSIFTCDRPLCRNCVKESYPIIFCGKKGHVDTRDLCAGCVDEDFRVGPGSREGRQELFTLADGRALQKRRLFHPAPSPTALERAYARIAQLEKQISEQGEKP